jgi:hypothetical protein
MALCWLSLLVILPLAVAGAVRMADKASDGSSTRIGWYVRSGQWLADVRTFTGACQFMMEGDMDTPSHDNSPVNQSVGNPGLETVQKSGNRSQLETSVN